MEEKLEILMAGQKTIKDDIMDMKRLFTSKYSELLTVVNSLNARLTHIGDSKTVICFDLCILFFYHLEFS